MPQRVLLDTSIIIEYLRISDKKNSRLVKLAQQQVELSISSITYAELFSGKSVWENQKNRDALDTICRGLQIIAFDENIARESGRIRAESDIDLLDAGIAATALLGKWVLSTLNKKDFKKVRDLQILE